MVQAEPMANPAPQLGAPAGNAPVLNRWNGAARVNVPPVRLLLPVLVTVTIFTRLLVKRAQVPKSNELGLTVAVSTCATVPANSTAPASTEEFALREVP